MPSPDHTDLPPLPPKWTVPLVGAPTFQFTGDHEAVEEWAAYLVTQHTGTEPDQAVFEGDCRGIYINPQRLAEIGIASTLAETARVAYGESVKFEGGEFLPVSDQWTKKASESERPGDAALRNLTGQLDQLGIRTYTTTSPILVKAVQLTEDADWEAIAAWCGGEVEQDAGCRVLVIPGVEPRGIPGDWVIQGVTGKYFTKYPEEFAATYTPATDEQRGPFAVLLRPTGQDSARLLNAMESAPSTVRATLPMAEWIRYGLTKLADEQAIAARQQVTR